ncbi:DUF58 domain-containing protein [Sphingomonas sp. AP4-R1]|uniref:DUF58 domain-containing protein n=1 Tax=Sphingomonas sp. AP4-R1 TaxID=2735134 RepID=UPI001493335A|nr:DUF58 domain-containing protein [Sphingomonas sp. AP4-R1]QJU57996.1 DUF58 domain-containing protein [Sphingomonas sp. AP4-R1]
MRGRRVETALTGDHRSIFRGRGMEFDQVVRFEFGDDIRDVDWNVTARLGEVYRKVFIEDREASIAVIFADHPALQFGSGERTKRDTLLELAGLVMLLGVLNRERVMLIHDRPEGARTYPPARRRDRVMATAGALFASPPPDPLAARASASPFVRHDIPKGSIIVWIGEVPDAPPPPEWGGWTRRHPVIGVRAEDRWERDGPAAGALQAYDPVAGRVVRLRDDAETRERHAAWRAAREARWNSWWPNPADRLTIGPHEDALAALTHFLRARDAWTAR